MSAEESETSLQISVLLILAILVVYIFSAHLIEVQKVLLLLQTFKIDFLHESGVAIILGAFSGLIIYSVILIYFTLCSLETKRSRLAEKDSSTLSCLQSYSLQDTH